MESVYTQRVKNLLFPAEYAVRNISDNHAEHHKWNWSSDEIRTNHCDILCGNDTCFGIDSIYT
jgi:hypothetical protein